METYSENLVWMDLEMTGLDPEVDRVLEIATLITDSSLNLVAEGPVIVVRQPDDVLEGMDDIKESIEELRQYRDNFFRVQ